MVVPFSAVLTAMGGGPREVIAFLFLLLLLYSLLGWCGEMVYCSLCQRKFCEKRGFLNGPICPIYGHGALLVLVALDGGCQNPILTFLLGMLLTSIVEYITSFAMEKLFHMRWWDYSRYRFNINGRVCLRNSALFGAACVLLCHGVGPRLTIFIARLIVRGSGVPMAAALSVLYGADIVLSVRSALQIRARLEKLHAIEHELSEKLEHLREEHRQAREAQLIHLEEAIVSARHDLEEKRSDAMHAVQSRLEPLSGELAQHLEAARRDAKQRMKALYEKPDIFERRLLQSFPAMHSPRHGEALEKLREYLKNQKD